MKLPAPLALELLALGLLIAAVAIAEGLWPGLVAGAAGVAYLAHAEDWGGAEVTLWPRRKTPETTDASQE